MVHFTMMGAGKGQPRRLNKAAMIASAGQNNPLEGVSLSYNPRTWANWANSLDARDVSIVSFYYGTSKWQSGIALADEEKSFILNEIFLDAVDNGAISFSTKVNPKDFSFKLDRANKKTSYSDVDLIMEYAPQKMRKVIGVAPFFDACLGRDCRINAMRDIFDRLCYTVADAAHYPKSEDLCVPCGYTQDAS